MKCPKCKSNYHVCIEEYSCKEGISMLCLNPDCKHDFIKYEEEYMYED